nr:glycosyltransferase family 39 protein [Acidimicrobiia bacterium]
VIVRFAAATPLWLDEALSVAIARLDLAELPAALRRDGHPPLYYLVLRAWSGAFGDGDLAVRSLSGLFAVATLPLAWLSGRRVAGRHGAAAALVLVAISPFAVRYATETRMYAMVMALVFAGHLLLRSALDGRPSPDGNTAAGFARRLVGLAVVAGALYLTHYWSFFLAAATVAALAVVWRRDPRAWRRAAALRAGMAVVAGGVLFLPWLASFLSQLGSTGTPWGTAARPTDVFGATFVDLGGPAAEGVLLSGTTLVLLAVGLFAVRPGLAGRTEAPSTGAGVELDLGTAPPARGEAAVAVATLALGGVVGFLTEAAYASRYAAVVFPLLVLVAARGVAALSPPKARVIALVGVVALGAPGVYRALSYDRTQAEVLAAAIVAEAGPDDVVVTCPDQLGPSLVRALDQDGAGALRVVGYPTLERPERVDWFDYADRNRAAVPRTVAGEVLASVPADATVWLVTNPAYRTFEGRCERLEVALGAARLPRSVVSARPDRYFESAELIAFDPVPDVGAGSTSG